MIEVNGRRYATPRVRTAAVCLDGVDPAYIDDALERGLLPRLRETIEGGLYAIGRGQLPSFTNPNNLSIVTGSPPATHGLPGNHYLAPDGREVQLDDPEQLRAPSILAAFADAGVAVLAVTTKDKLRRLLAKGGVPTVSVERADELSAGGIEDLPRLVGRPAPNIYDWDASHYALELGFALADVLETELLYVSLTDAVQHLQGPGGDLADRYLGRLDELVGMYVDAGWRLGLVADHGMNSKPRIQFLEDVLRRSGLRSAHVVLPITDPYVVHHAALGSACWIHLAPEELETAVQAIEPLTGVEAVFSGDRAATEFALPRDRIGDLFVLGDRDTAFGKTKSAHDLSTLRGPLRSHGGQHEQAVPILLSEPPGPAGQKLLRDGATNADIYALVLE